MKKIKKLNKNIIAKIIALSIKNKKTYTIKELLENSCDAKSTYIKIYIEKNNNEEIIKIIDNGEGIYKNDLYTVFSRYTTNKITTEDDLNNLNTYGFKGESLNNIKCIAELIIKSKPTDQEYAYKIIFNKNKYLIEKCSSDNGTEIIIKNIKTDKKKEKDIFFYFKMLALVNFDIHFQLIENGLEIYNLPKCYSNIEKAQRIEKILGKDSLKNSIDITHNNNNNNNNNIKINGIMAVTNKKQKPFNILFLNNRYIKNEKIKKFIIENIKKYTRLPKINYCIFMHMPQNKHLISSLYKTNTSFHNINEILDIFKNIIENYKNDIITIKNENKNIANLTNTDKHYHVLNKNIYKELPYKNKKTILTITNNDTIFFEHEQNVYTVKLFNLREKIITNELIKQLTIYGNIQKRSLSDPLIINLKKNINLKSYNAILNLYGFDVMQLLNKNIIVYNVPEVIFNLEIDWQNLINDMLIKLEKNISSHFSKNRFDITILKTIIDNIKKTNPVYEFEIEYLNKKLQNIIITDLNWIDKNCKIYKK